MHASRIANCNVRVFSSAKLKPIKRFVWVMYRRLDWVNNVSGHYTQRLFSYEHYVRIAYKNAFTSVAK